jgi:hypothetical protein
VTPEAPSGGIQPSRGAEDASKGCVLLDTAQTTAAPSRTARRRRKRGLLPLPESLTPSLDLGSRPPGGEEPRTGRGREGLRAPALGRGDHVAAACTKSPPGILGASSRSGLRRSVQCLSRTGGLPILFITQFCMQFVMVCAMCDCLAYFPMQFDCLCCAAKKKLLAHPEFLT